MIVVQQCKGTKCHKTSHVNTIKIIYFMLFIFYHKKKGENRGRQKN